MSDIDGYSRSNGGARGIRPTEVSVAVARRAAGGAHRDRLERAVSLLGGPAVAELYDVSDQQAAVAAFHALGNRIAVICGG